MSISLVSWLESWYHKQTDGVWEHSYGIEIKTLDNPGWSVTIDLNNTVLDSCIIERVFMERDEDDWVDYRVENNQFMGCGGPLNLAEILDVFKKLINSKNL